MEYRMELSLIVILYLTHLLSFSVGNPVIPTSGHLNFTGLVERHGYTSESHAVTTEDGYNIRIDRISGAPLSPEAPGKPVVHILHGIAICSEFWVLWAPNDSLAFILADAGYDVWIANVRGNTNGRSHQTLDPDRDREFWDFDLNTMATRDLPAQVDFILERTAESKLTLIGHSMGTTLSYILLSEKPEYNDKINLVVSLAPVAYWHPKSLGIVRIIFNAGFHAVRLLVDAPDMNAEVLRHGPHVKKFADDYCNPRNNDLCLIVLNVLLEHIKNPISFEELRYIMEYGPSGVSIKTLYHYLQNVNSGGFHKYDYESPEANFEHYGQQTPPQYNLTKIEAPVILYHIEADFFAPEISTRILEKHLPSLIVSEVVHDKAFIHADFVILRNGKRTVLERVVQLIDENLKIKGKL